MPKNQTPDPRSANLFASAQRYAVSTLHRPMRIGPPIPYIPDTPPHYRLAEANIGGVSCILMLPGEPVTPDALASDANRRERQLKKLVIVVAPVMTSADRARLIQRGVSFIVPGNQLYAPPLAVDLRETFRQPVRIYKGGLTPVAQAVLFHVALAGPDETTPSKIVSALDYTPMSAGRAIDELAAHGVGQVEKRGRQKVFSLPKRRAAIENARDLLRAPYRGVHAVRFCKHRPKMHRAGETALAALADIKTDALPTYAIPSQNWAAFFEQHDIKTGDDAIIETWRYDPSILSKGSCVDPLSLYAQYWNNPDARLAEAARNLLTRVLG